MIKKIIAFCITFSLLFSQAGYCSFRTDRAQLERMRRLILYDIGHSTKIMNDKENLEKGIGAVMKIDLLIVKSYLQEQEEREKQAQEKEYAQLKEK